MQTLDTEVCHLDRRRFVVQRVDASGSWSYPLHRHVGFSELFYIARGSIDHRLNDHPDHLPAGSLVLVRERDRHALTGSGLRYFNLNVLSDDLRRVAGYLDGGDRLSAALGAESAPPAVLVPPGERREVEDQFARLFDCQASAAAAPLYQRTLVMLLTPFVSPPVTAVGSGPPAWLGQSLEEAAGDLARTTPATLARRAGVSPAHLARSMRRHLGTTPSAWINRCRLERAALRLAYTNQAIPAICFDLGFHHLSWFYRVFQRAHGCAPAAYRRRYGTAV
jgi:AraC family cel operon transcriptional repressor